MSARPSTEYHRAALKAAFRKLVRKIGGQEAAAGATRVGQQAISRYGSASSEADHAPIDVVLDLCLDAEDDSFVRTLCQMVGGVFVPLPDAGALDGDRAAAFGKALRATGEASAAIADVCALGAGSSSDIQFSEKLTRATEAMIALRAHVSPSTPNCEMGE
ncbi:hypothetical protein [Roseibium sediminis]|uniref:hypothetical protein n=1 Tax=Roseibium sediminis TaxID=1775174 RepID=UPI00123E3248|nr:hypothetical protein [Roseibium sediminis]